jgi:murein DD-endopeptidase MepM/ murein hydrolase activator NlpD
MPILKAIQVNVGLSSGKPGKLLPKLKQLGRVTGPHLHWIFGFKGIQLIPLIG